MSQFRLFFNHILTLGVLFFTAIIIATSSGLNSAVVAQRITSPGLTTPTATPNPSESPISIPVPPPKNPRPGNTTPTSSPSALPANYAGRTLTVSERDRIISYLQSRKISPPVSPNAPANPRFILHDTSILMPANILERERQIGRGPMGLGVSAFLPRNSDPVIARPNFYEPRRPTTTEFEKASDIMVLSERERLFRLVWQATKSDARRQGLDAALTNLGLSSSEIVREKQAATEKLTAASGRIYTTGAWTIESICDRYTSGDKSLAVSPERENSLSSACGALNNYFNIRNNRVRSSVAAEIVQVGVRSNSGNQTTCDANNANIATLPNPAYSEIQYDRTLALYFRAALAAGKFPQITTHFALDTFDPQAHCDPRCFNLTKLYQKSASVLAHRPGSSYGIEPSYGTRLGRNNIWWNDRICRAAPP